ncbi:predicted protein [Chaetoceros tenuissimus]|uniref:Uncharacterized protein n=1 Tax=Chaetoceros tenuissimus TaxID=426638 RepID=A0AAD3CGX0_9STRA|nr:predicted protein [Chaetoceros tenuissimus]
MQPIPILPDYEDYLKIPKWCFTLNETDIEMLNVPGNEIIINNLPGKVVEDVWDDFQKKKWKSKSKVDKKEDARDEKDERDEKEESREDGKQYKNLSKEDLLSAVRCIVCLDNWARVHGKKVIEGRFIKSSENIEVIKKPTKMNIFIKSDEFDNDDQLQIETKHISAHREKVDFVKDIDKCLSQFRGDMFYKQHLCFSKRSQWESWALFSIDDKRMDEFTPEKKRKWMNGRSKERCEKISKILSKKCEEYEITVDDEKENEKCSKCQYAKNIDNFANFTNGEQTFGSYIRKIKIDGVPCVGCWKKLILINSTRFSRLMLMLLTSRASDESVEANYVPNLSRLACVDDYFRDAESMDCEVLRLHFFPKIKGIGLGNKNSVAIPLLLYVFRYVFDENIIDMTFEEICSFRQVGVKKAGVASDLCAGLDSHILDLTRRWNWSTEKNEQKRHDEVTRFFEFHRDIMPLLNRSLVTICQLFQDEATKLIGVAMLEFLLYYEDCKYSDFVFHWYVKEFSSKNKTMEKTNVDIVAWRRKFWDLYDQKVDKTIKLRAIEDEKLKAQMRIEKYTIMVARRVFSKHKIELKRANYSKIELVLSFVLD